MNEPPNSPYLARLRSGQPIVWTMWPSGFAHLPDLLDAERPDLRLLAREPEAVDRGAGQVALRALGEDVTFAAMSEPGS